MAPAIILSIATAQPEMVAMAGGTLVEDSSVLMKKLSIAISDASREAAEVGVTKGAETKLLSKAPKQVAELAKYITLPTITKESSLGNILKILEDAKKNIKTYGYVVKNTDKALMSTVAEGFHAEEGEWMIRLVTNMPTDAVFSAETSMLGRVNDQGMSFWGTTLEFVKNEDNDLDKLRRKLGMPPLDKSKKHYYIIYRNLPESNTVLSFSPTFEKMGSFMAKYAKRLKKLDISPSAIKKALSEGYKNEYSEKIKNIPADAWDQYKLDLAMNYAESIYSNDIEKQQMFLARFFAHLKYGAFDQWEGNGLTKYMGYQSEKGASDAIIDKKYGAPELFVFMKNPQNIADMGVEYKIFNLEVK